MQIRTEALIVKPLETVTVTGAQTGSISVRDGDGVEYVTLPAADSVSFRVSGALGTHNILNLDANGLLLDTAAFKTACKTYVADDGGRYSKLLQGLYKTLVNASSGDGSSLVEVNGKLYTYYICWLRDHTHTMKGMKFFDQKLKTGLELYADTQREDGMIYDRIRPKADVQGWRDYTFREGDFITTLNRGTQNPYTLQRIPVENDVEYLFLECLYYTWKASGDTAWMAQYLDHCKKAVTYATSDQYRWSEKYGLLKRGYTIDTWDFVHADDGKLTLGDNVCDINKTTFGVMFGDNTGMAVGCRYLAEMLRAAGRDTEAPEYDKLADDLYERLEDLAWNGEFYTHHVSEDPSFKRDVGNTDEAAQVTLSNAYSINRQIGKDKNKAIIKTYQRIREEMPANSPGEFYNCYPPFERGFHGPDHMWQYMNGGVSTIVGGELAHGAFENGFEEYGADILDRILGLADRYGGRLHVCFNGNPETEPPAREFTPVDLGEQANVTGAWKAEGGWGDEGNDLSRMPTGDQEFVQVPFQICGDGRGLGLSSTRAGFAEEIHVPIDGTHGSIYLLHTAGSGGAPPGEMEVHYADGQVEHQYIAVGGQLGSWFMPGSVEGQGFCHAPKLPHGWPDYQLAWRGGNDTFENVGIFIWGWNNPRPDAEIKEVVFRAAKNGGTWFVPGMTLCDQPVWFPQSDLSFGIPDCWGSAAVVYALLEGLAGIKDEGVAFDRATVAPRWTAAGVAAANVAVTYPASGGYAAYEYVLDGDTARIGVAANGDDVTFKFLLPAGKSASAVKVNGEVTKFDVEAVEKSNYVILNFTDRGVHEIEISLT